MGLRLRSESSTAANSKNNIRKASPKKAAKKIYGLNTVIVC
jgi:hypothetical protein